jgi:hypothetical protein
LFLGQLLELVDVEDDLAETVAVLALLPPEQLFLLSTLFLQVLKRDFKVAHFFPLDQFEVLHLAIGVLYMLYIEYLGLNAFLICLFVLVDELLLLALNF